LACGFRRLARAALGAGLAIVPAVAPAEEPRPPWTAELTYSADALANLRGGIDEGAAWLGRADATLEIDGRAIGLPGATLFFDIVYSHGPDFSGRRVGDAQVVSNVQGDGILRPYEAWLSVPIGADLAVKAGMVDLNSEFDVQSVGAFFINASHGIGPDFSQSGANGPSIYPVPTTAAIVKWESDNGHVKAGLFNARAGDPDHPRKVRIPFPGEDGALIVAEGAARIGAARAQIGGWIYTSAEERIAEPGRRAKGSKGAYGQIEARLAGRDGDKGDDGDIGDDGGAALDGWIRIGTADRRTNRIGFYAGGGLTWGDERRRSGFAVAHARQSDRAARDFLPEEGPQKRAETSFEIGHARQLADFLSVQPFAQYVVNPGWRADLPDAVVAGVRLDLAFALR